MKTDKNPPWTRDELILALDLFFRVNPLHTTSENPAIQDLSNILNVLPFHPQSKRQKTFRNPTGVYMTLRTFLKWDPSYPGQGLDGGRLGKEVWDEFSDDREHLVIIAKAIRSAANLSNTLTHSPDGFEDEENFPEGRILARLHILRERNSSLVKRKKEQSIVEKGHLACEVCDFDFEKTYGSLGIGFAECHHRIPLASLPQQRISRVKDLAIVCANCHRMLHRIRPWMSVEQLRLKFMAVREGRPDSV